MSAALDLNDPIAVLLRVASALRGHGIDNAAYGGLALAVYGEPRETKDADLAVAALDPELTEAALREAGLSIVRAFERVRFGGHSITRFTLLGGTDPSGLNTADLVEPRSQRYAAVALQRAMEGHLRGEAIKILAPEDFVLFKVLSTRERDLEDATAVLRMRGPELDRRLIDREATLLAVEIADHDVAGRLGRVYATS